MLTDSLPELDYGRLLKVARTLDALPASQTIRLALLSDAATQQFVPVLKVLLRRNGFAAEIYEAPFDAIELECINPASGLYRFEPDAVVVLNSTQALRPDFLRRTGDGAAFARDTCDRIGAIWTTLQAHSRATILQSTFVLPYERFFGNYDRKTTQSFYSAVLDINARICEAARERAGVLLHDVDAIASWVGRRGFFDERFWDLWKAFCSLEHLPRVAQNIVDVLMASRGRAVKCVIVDLDNTLWGGIIGDDGLEGIKLSAHGDGEAFHRLQLYLKELHARGILLGVCSKNEEAAALLPFQNHPEMVLKREDMTVFLANWDNKAKNIRRARELMNIGFDSIVFLDDSPFERNLVREVLPGVIVPELPEDPSDFVRFLSELNLFETTSFSAEDLARGDMYRREIERREAAAGFAGVDDFMRSLAMRITVAPFDEFHLPRIVQLLQRSNQFNLTTRRRGESECEAIMSDPRVIPLYAKLSDRLGDHGLISIVILEIRGDTLAITDWLMSCRVLTRGVEQYLMNELFARARALGKARVRGEYISTSKNGMVRDFFAGFGFRCVSDAAGRTEWELEVASYQPRPTLVTATAPAEKDMAVT